MLFILLPFSTFYYETSEDISTKVRIVGALFRSFSYAILSILAVVITYFILKSPDAQSFTVYVIAFQMILGWFLLFFSLGAGLIAIPFDLIYSFLDRPQPMKTAEFETKKKMLLNNLLFMRLRCNEALEERPKIDTQRGIKGWWNNARLTRKVASLHSKSIVLEEEYIKLVKISKYNKFVEPIAYYFKFILAIIIIIINACIIVQLVGCQLIDPSKKEECSFKFFNTVINSLSKESTGLGFITTAIIFLLSCHLTYSAFYGNVKLGLRFVIYTYAPLTPKETLYNNI